MVRAGILEQVALEIAGYETRAVFARYHIASVTDLREAAEGLNRAVSTRNGYTFGHIALLSFEEKQLSS